MYVRTAKSRDEPWLLEQLTAMDLTPETAPPREFVVAVNEDTDRRAGFGRLRIHAGDDIDAETAALTCLGVLPAWRNQGVGAHIVERLLTIAGDDAFESVCAVTDEPTYFTQFGFADCESVPDSLPATPEPDETVLSIAPAEFTMPTRLRERFKEAAPATEASEEPTETAADFGIDAETATYKYDTGS